MNEEIENQELLNTGEEDTTLDENGTDDLTTEVEPEGETLEEKAARLEEQNRRLYARLQKTKTKAEAPKEPKPEPQKEVATATDSNEELIRARLEVRGYLSEDEQDIILKASKALGMSPMEAANDDIVKAKIEKVRQEQKVDNAIPSPSGKAGSQKKDVSYYIEKDELPEDPEMFEKVQAELVRRARENPRLSNPN